MRFPRSLWIVMIVYCALAGSYAALVPPWETPDEPAHYRYVTELARRWRPPADPEIRQKDSFCRDYVYTTSNYEWYHPALGYLPLAVVYKVLQLIAPHSLPADIPPFNPLFCSDPFTHPNLFRLETPRPLDIWQHNWGLLCLRIASSLWGLVVIIATYQIGQSLKMGTFAVVAAAGVAFLPQFTFINASIRNDTVSNAISALLFLLAVNMQIFPQRRDRLALMTGLILGAGLLTKLTLAYLIPMVLLAVILPPPRSLQKIIRPIIYVIVLPFAIAGLYHLCYQEARAALIHTKAQMVINPGSLSWTYWKSFVPMLVDLFYARFGWANVLVPSLWIKIALGIWMLGIGLSSLRMIQLLSQGMENPEGNVLILLYFGLLLALAGTIRYNFSHFQPQGRFLFPALAAWALLSMWGLATALPKRARLLAGLAIAGFMLLFNLRSLVILVSTYY